jgi:toxin ParE1/3/4
VAAARYSPRALRDVEIAITWLANENPDAAAALRASFDEAAERIGMHPGIGIMRPDLARSPFRFLFLTRFPYVVVYDPTRTPALIARVVHAARDLPELLQDL